MRVGLEVVDDLLPVCSKNISIGALKALIHLLTVQFKGRPVETLLTFAQAPV